jgi:hypothetical protein
MVTGGGETRTGGAGAGLVLDETTGAGGLTRLSSPELQLEIPNAANSDRTRTVKATRAGVHRDFAGLVLFIAITLTRYHLFPGEA